MTMKEFIIFIGVLTILLVGISLLLDQLMAVFIVGIITCVTLTVIEKDKGKNNKL